MCRSFTSIYSFLVYKYDRIQKTYPKGVSAYLKCFVVDTMWLVWSHKLCVITILCPWVHSNIPLLKIRDYRGKTKQVMKSLVPQSDADVFAGDMPFMSALVYITNAMMNAKFTGLSIDEFKTNYLSPFDKTIKESKIQYLPCLNPVFPYPLAYDWDDEFDIHQYFRQDISGSIERI